MNEQTEQSEHDLQAMKLRAPSGELDGRVVDFFSVEQHLLGQKLSEPSTGLDDRVAAIFTETTMSDAPDTYRPAIWHRVSRVAIPLAACLAIGLTVFFATRPASVT